MCPNYLVLKSDLKRPNNTVWGCIYDTPPFGPGGDIKIPVHEKPTLNAFQSCCILLTNCFTLSVCFIFHFLDTRSYQTFSLGVCTHIHGIGIGISIMYLIVYNSKCNSIFKITSSFNENMESLGN